jgi:hypothetical protein
MSNHPHPVSRFPRLRKLWKPAVASGAGGTTLAIWFEEIMAFAADFIGVIVISLMAGLIYLYKTYVFKSAIPGSDDLKKK